MESPDPFSEDSPLLDELLKSARWDGDSESEVVAAITRIQHRLASPSPCAQGTAWQSYVVAAIAAAIIMALMLQLTVFSKHGDKIAVRSESPPVARATVPPEPEKKTPEPYPESEQESELDTQPQESMNDLYALVLWHAAQREQQQTQWEPSIQEQLTSFCQLMHRRLVAVQQAEGPCLPVLFPSQCAHLEQQLWTWCRHEQHQHRAAAAWGLGAIGSRRSLSVLHMLLTDRPQVAVQAAYSLARLATTEELGVLIGDQIPSHLRQWLLAGLVRKGTMEATSLYLDFVADRTHRRDALACLKFVPNLAAGPFIAYLRNDDMKRGRAAAWALATTPSPDAAAKLERLLQLDAQNDFVWLAAVARPEHRLRQLLMNLNAHPTFAAKIRQAQNEILGDLTF